MSRIDEYKFTLKHESDMQGAIRKMIERHKAGGAISFTVPAPADWVDNPVDRILDERQQRGIANINKPFRDALLRAAREARYGVEDIDHIVDREWEALTEFLRTHVVRV